MEKSAAAQVIDDDDDDDRESLRGNVQATNGKKESKREREGESEEAKDEDR